MKKKSALLVLITIATMSWGTMVSAEESITIDEANFPDEVFRTYVSENFDENKDDILQPEEIAKATIIDFDYGTYWVTDLSGIEYLTKLESLNCSFNGVSALDLSENTELQYLDCSYNEELEEINVSANTKLQELHCYETPVSAIDVTHNPELVRLDCNNTTISELDVTHNQKLFALNVEKTNLTSIDISNNPELYEVYVTGTAMTELDISNNPRMGQIRVDNTSITNMDFSNNPELVAVRCSDTNISELDFSNNPQMYEIFCFNTPIKELDLTGLTGLHTVECYNTGITRLDVSDCVNLVGLICNETGISKLDVTNNPELKRLECSDTLITSLDLRNNVKLRLLNISNTRIKEMGDFDGGKFPSLEELYCNNAGIKNLDLTKNSLLYSLDCGQNELVSLDLSGVGSLWYIATVSPQNPEKTGIVSDNKMTLDLKTFVKDTSRVEIEQSEAYSYDKKTGIIYFNNIEECEVAYSYNHGYPGDLEMMKVHLKVIPKNAEEESKPSIDNNNNNIKADTPNVSSQKNNKTENVRTGDNNHIFMWLTAAIVSILCVVSIIKKKRV